MTSADLERLIQEGEGTTLEFKESLSASFAREVVALANTLGGKILLGVRDDGSVAGIRDTNALRARIQDIARNCDPPVRIRIEQSAGVTVVHVRESEAKPVQCSDGFFWRQGAVTQKLSRVELRDFFREEGAIRFDLSPSPRFRYPDDFDAEKFDAWLSRSGITGRPRVEDVLVNIGAAERVGGELVFLNAGTLFFAKNVRRFFPDAYITCLLAKGTEKVRILDRKDFSDGILADIENAMGFVERNTRTAYRIEGLQRTDVPEYPTNALREAITNAVMHRDWFLEGANVFIEIYANRIEVVSPGGLPKGMPAAELGRKSVRRNPLIADLLHRVGFIEKAGTGIERIRGEAREHGCAEPEFEVGSFFSVTFRPNPAVREESAGRPHKQVTPLVSPLQGDSQVNLQVTPLVAQMQRLLQAISGEMTRRSLQAKLGLKDPAHFRKTYLNPAIQAGFIEAALPDKPHSRLQRYRLTPVGQAVLARAAETSAPHADSPVTPPSIPQVNFQAIPLVAQMQRLLQAISGEMTRRSLQAKLGLKDPAHFRKTYLNPAIQAGFIEAALPDKPHSRLQRYRLTPVGQAALARAAETSTPHADSPVTPQDPSS